MNRLVIVATMVVGMAAAIPAFAFTAYNPGETDVPSAVNYGKTEQQAAAAQYTGKRLIAQRATRNEAKTASVR
jgi:hypothetical protein